MILSYWLEVEYFSILCHFGIYYRYRIHLGDDALARSRGNIAENNADSGRGLAYASATPSISGSCHEVYAVYYGLSPGSRIYRTCCWTLISIFDTLDWRSHWARRQPITLATYGRFPSTARICTGGTYLILDYYRSVIIDEHLHAWRLDMRWLYIRHYLTEYSNGFAILCDIYCRHKVEWRDAHAQDIAHVEKHRYWQIPPLFINDIIRCFKIPPPSSAAHFG